MCYKPNRKNEKGDFLSFIYIYIHIHTHIHTHTCARAHTPTHTHTHIYIYIYIPYRKAALIGIILKNKNTSVIIIECDSGKKVNNSPNRHSMPACVFSISETGENLFP